MNPGLAVATQNGFCGFWIDDMFEETQMFQFKTLAAAPALVILMGGTAHAALTADQVWQSWKDGAAMGDV